MRGNRLLENFISGRTRMGRLATGNRGPVRHGSVETNIDKSASAAPT